VPETPATENDIFEVIATQRAMRRLKPDPVPEEHIKKILWAATRAPNGGNVQPWRFLVITDPERKRALGRIYAEEWARYRSMDNAASRAVSSDADRRSLERTFAAGDYLAAHFHEAPVIIIPCGFLLAVNSGIASGSSIYPAVQNLMLAARALGLGTALTTLHRQREDDVRELLGIPPNAHIAAVIPVGYPMGHFGSGPRLPVEAVTYWDQWGAKRP